MSKKINSQALLEFICFAFSAVLFFYLTLSGSYLSYVTSRTVPFLYIASAVMAAWAAVKFPLVFQPRHKTHAAHCFVLAVPILLLLLPHSSISASSISTGLADLTSQTTTTSSSNDDATLADADSAEPGEDSADETEDQTDSGTENAGESGDSDDSYDNSLVEEYGLALSDDGSIVVSNDLFYPWLSEICLNMEQYVGVTITLTGFVYRDSESFDEDEFVPARFLMYCCAADMVPCGIICKYDGASELEEDAWVTVTGVVQIGEYQGAETPQVVVTSVVSAEAPDVEYVYPW